MRTSVSLQLLFEEFLQNRKHIETFVDATVRSYRCDFRVFLRFLEDQGVPKTLAAFNSHNLARYQDYRKERKAAGNTVKRFMSSLAAFGDWAIENGLLRENPVRRFKRGFIRLDRREFRFEDATSARRFLEVPVKSQFKPCMDRALRHALLYLGLRTSEVLKLRWRHIDLDQGQVSIFDTKNTRLKRTENKLDRVIPLCQPVRVALLELKLSVNPDPGDPVIWHRRGHVTGKDAFYEFYKEIKSACGMPKDFVPHCLRHSLASNIQEVGATNATVALLLGHKWALNDEQKPTSTSAYLVGSRSLLRECLEKYAAKVTGTPEPSNTPVASSAVEAPISQLTKPVKSCCVQELPPALAGRVIAFWGQLYGGRPVTDPGFRDFVESYIKSLGGPEPGPTS